MLDGREKVRQIYSTGVCNTQSSLDVYYNTIQYNTT